MKPLARLFLAVLAFGFVPAGGLAAETLQPDGFIQVDRRSLLGDSAQGGDTFAKARVGIGFRAGADVFLRAGVEGRFFNLPLLEDLPVVEAVEADYPTHASLREAFVALDGVFWSNLDLKLGKQRIAWGRADGFNPTDNLNPDDLTDFFDFGAKQTSWALHGSLYLGDSTLSLALLPDFKPALLPQGGTVALFGVPPVAVERPEVSSRDPMYAVKYSGLAGGVDFSVSYFRGFDSLPLPVITAEGAVLRFPEIEVLGLDFAGEAASIGFRGEVARFRPVALSAEAAAILPDEDYVKYTLGAEYTFQGGVFLEVQLVRGFPTERGAGALNDFLVVTVRRNFLGDKLKTELTVAFDGKGGRDGADSEGSGQFPQLTYTVFDNLEVGLGAYLLTGDEGSVFGRHGDADQAFLKARFTF